MTKHTKTRAKKEAAIKRFERLYLGGAVFFAGLAILFYFGVISFGDGKFAAMWLAAGAAANVITVKLMGPKMRAQLGERPHD